MSFLIKQKHNSGANAWWNTRKRAWGPVDAAWKFKYLDEAEDYIFDTDFYYQEEGEEEDKNAIEIIDTEASEKAVRRIRRDIEIADDVSTLLRLSLLLDRRIADLRRANDRRVCRWAKDSRRAGRAGS